MISGRDCASHVFTCMGCNRSYCEDCELESAVECEGCEKHPLCNCCAYTCKCGSLCEACGKKNGLACPDCEENLRSGYLPTLGDDDDEHYCVVITKEEYMKKKRLPRNPTPFNPFKNKIKKQNVICSLIVKIVNAIGSFEMKKLVNSCQAGNPMNGGMQEQRHPSNSLMRFQVSTMLQKHFDSSITF